MTVAPASNRQAVRFARRRVLAVKAGPRSESGGGRQQQVGFVDRQGFPPVGDADGVAEVGNLGKHLVDQVVQIVLSVRGNEREPGYVERGHQVQSVDLVDQPGDLEEFELVPVAGAVAGGGLGGGGSGLQHPAQAPADRVGEGVGFHHPGGACSPGGTATPDGGFDLRYPRSPQGELIAAVAAEQHMGVGIDQARYDRPPSAIEAGKGVEALG